MLPTAANLAKFGREGQPFAKAGSPVFICLIKKPQGAVSISKQEDQERV
jgi:hypothetical protein